MFLKDIVFRLKKGSEFWLKCKVRDIGSDNYIHFEDYSPVNGWVRNPGCYSENEVKDASGLVSEGEEMTLAEVESALGKKVKIIN